MMSTRRSLTLAIYGIVMLALAGPAVAQDTDTAPATVRPNGFFSSSTGATGGEVSLAVAAADDMGYQKVDISWTVHGSFRKSCADDGSPVAPAVACATSTGGDVGDMTPLTGFVVYYAEMPFTDGRDAGVMSMNVSGGATALTTGSAKAMLEGLDPETEYYVAIAARNIRGDGDIAEGGAKMVMTGAAPKPAAVTGVMVEPGDKMLTVSWDPANPDMGVTRTNLVVTKYYVQYRKSQTAIALAGEWMPEKPMEVMGDMTTTMIDGLMNDMSYDVQVRAENNAGGKGDWSAQTPRSKGTPMPMTPTPALPLFGAFGLGVGLLAAGRARLRRRAQRQLTR